MKTRSIFLGLAAAVLAFTSCGDILDKAPDGRITIEEVYKDPDKVAAALNSCYYNIHQKNIWYYWQTSLPVAWTDDAWSSEDGNNSVKELYAGTYTPNNHKMAQWNYDGRADPSSQTYWEIYFAQIRACTEFLEHIGTATVRSEAERNRFTAEAHVLRAFFYMELIKWYGKLPIERQTFPPDYDYSQLKRESVAEVAKFINEDCDAALAVADNQFPWRITSESEAPRVTKALAWALKAKSWLFAASPLHNDGENHWQTAYEVNRDAVAALKTNGYELFTQCTEPDAFGTGPAAAYHQLAVTSMEWKPDPNDKETIWQLKKGGRYTYHVAYVGNEPGMYMCGNCPTQELVDAYEVYDGTNAYPLLDLSKPYNDEKHLQPNYNPQAQSIYDENDPYANRDPRFYVSVLYNGATFFWDNRNITLETYEGGRHGITFSTAARTKSRTGYINKKMVHPRSSGTIGTDNSPWKYYRLGELLLDLAEAAAEAGHEAEALAALNEVRDRVGMPAVTDTGDQLILRIRNERRIEMMWEESRFFDLRRWQSPDGDLGQTCKWLTAMYITKNGDQFTYQRRNISASERGGWENKNLLMPLTTNEASLMENFTGDKWQNPGW